MKTQKKLIILIFSILILILIFAVHIVSSSKNVININQENLEMENVFNEYISARNAQDINKALQLLYFKPEYEYYIDYYIDDMKAFPPDIQNFKINDIIQINKYLCQLDSVYTDAANNETIIWEPYIVKINGEFKIILNPRNIPNKYNKNVIINTNDEIL